MKTLVIPDIHNRIKKVESLLHTVTYDKVVFLGDYFDSFGDNIQDAERTAKFVKANINNPNYTFLFGNHDFWYAYPREFLWCPGNNHEKRRMIRSIISEPDWGRFKLLTEDQGWWMSHAGMHPKYFGKDASEFVAEHALNRCDQAIQNVKAFVEDPLVLWDCTRGGGMAPEGSILWLHWDSFAPIHGVNQIVGHTNNNWVRMCHEPDSLNYCLDTFSDYYGIIEDGKFSHVDSNYVSNNIGCL